MGFWHPDEYWTKSGNLEAETFAQMGRVLYKNDRKVLNMFKQFFPDSYDEIIVTLERMIK